MRESSKQLEAQMDKPEFRHAYADAFMNSFVAAQIKAIREQRGLTQSQLAELVGTKQAGISRLENVNYDAWKVETLAKLAKAFDVRLRISFEEFGSIFDEISRFGQASLEREKYADDKKKNAATRELRPDDREGLEVLPFGHFPLPRQARKQFRAAEVVASEIRASGSGSPATDPELDG